MNPRFLYACGHTFHLQCAESWLQRASTCPFCISPLCDGRIDDRFSLYSGVQEGTRADSDPHDEDDTRSSAPLAPATDVAGLAPAPPRERRPPARRVAAMAAAFFTLVGRGVPLLCCRSARTARLSECHDHGGV